MRVKPRLPLTPQALDLLATMRRRETGVRLTETVQRLLRNSLSAGRTLSLMEFGRYGAIGLHLRDGSEPDTVLAKWRGYLCRSVVDFSTETVSWNSREKCHSNSRSQ